MVDVKRTPTNRLLELALGEPLDGFVGALLDDERSYPYIARKLRERTDNTVPFSAEALRQWFADREPSERVA